MDADNHVVWMAENPGGHRTVPDGDPVQIRLWFGGREPGASEVVFVMEARPMPATPGGDMPSGMTFGPDDCLACRATGRRGVTTTGPWREFRRLEGGEAAVAIRAASESR